MLSTFFTPLLCLCVSWFTHGGQSPAYEGQFSFSTCEVQGFPESNVLLPAELMAAQETLKGLGGEAQYLMEDCFAFSQAP